MESLKAVYLSESPIGLEPTAARRKADPNENRILQKDLRQVGHKS